MEEYMRPGLLPLIQHRTSHDPLHMVKIVATNFLVHTFFEIEALPKAEFKGCCPVHI